jgi:hypothetical protein
MLNSTIADYEFSVLIVGKCNLTIELVCNEGKWNWWLRHIGTLVISLIGIFGNMFSLVVFSLNCKISKYSYISFLKLLSITDSCSLLLEFLISLNEWLNFNDYVYLYQQNNLICKLINYLSASFQLISTWLVCAFSIERCIAITFPFFGHRFLRLRNSRNIFALIVAFALSTQSLRLLWIQTSCSLKAENTNQLVDYLFDKKDTCLSRCDCAASPNSYGVFLLKYHVYFHELFCLVLAPSFIVIISNLIVIIRILQRKWLYNQLRATRRKFIQNASIELTSFTTLSIQNRIQIDQIKSFTCFSKKHQTSFLIQNERKRLSRRFFISTKVYLKDSALCVMILVSISFLALVLPSTMLNIIKFYSIKKSIQHYQSSKCLKIHSITSKLYIFEDLFALLRLLNYSSIYIIYLILSSRLRIKKKLKNLIH